MKKKEETKIPAHYEIYGLRIPSVKSYLQLHDPVILDVYFVEHCIDDPFFIGRDNYNKWEGRYETRIGKAMFSWGHGSGIHQDRPKQTSPVEHSYILEKSNMDLVTGGLTGYRSMLKHVFNAGEISRFGTLLNDKRDVHWKFFVG